jgi:hypothetical protein
MLDDKIIMYFHSCRGENEVQFELVEEVGFTNLNLEEMKELQSRTDKIVAEMEGLQ